MFQPNEKKILVKEVKVNDMTPGGIIIPTTVINDIMEAEVICVGEDVKIPTKTKVFFKKAGYFEITIEGEKYLVVDVEDVFGWIG